MSGLISPVTQSVRLAILLDTKLKVKYRGTGHTGYNLSVIKSALQKGCRRNDDKLVIWAIREAFLYYSMGQEFPDPKALLRGVHTNTSAKGFNTNIMNRIKIIAVEDCSPRAVLAVNRSVRCLDKYNASGFAEPIQLLNSGLYLVAAASSRVCSHLRVLCSYDEAGGVYYDAYTKCEMDNDNAITPAARMDIIFRYINCVTEATADEVRNMRIVAAYHTMKIYNQSLNKDNLGQKTPTPLMKKNALVTFWGRCYSAVALLASVNAMAARYEKELNYAISWRADFFWSKSYFKEESLLLLSMVDLLIAVAHGPKREFQALQEATPVLDCDAGGDFDWVNDHRAPDPMPPYVLDQHTSSPDKSVSFALQSSRIVNGDEAWSPSPLSSYYTSSRSRIEILTPEQRANLISKAGNLLKRHPEIHSQQCLQHPGGIIIPISNGTVDTPPSPSRSSSTAAHRQSTHYPPRASNSSASNCNYFPSPPRISNLSASPPHQSQPPIKRFLISPSASIARSPTPKKRKLLCIEPSSQVMTASEEKKIGYGGTADKLKDIGSLSEMLITEVKKVIAVHNNNSKKGVVATVRLDDDTIVVLKHMTERFGYGTHQNFVQNLKDNNTCGFTYLHPMPRCSKFRGLVRAKFEIMKTENSKLAHVVVPSGTENVYFVTGCVTQNGGQVVDARYSHHVFVMAKLQNSLEMLHIIAFRMLIGVNGTNPSNILVGEGGRLYSADENYVGSMTTDMIIDTRACRQLRNLLRENQAYSNMPKDELAKHMPEWMICETKRMQMLRNLNAQAAVDGICEETVDRIAHNSKFVYEDLFNFLSLP